MVRTYKCKTIKCPICVPPKRFKRKGLAAHMRKKHREVRVSRPRAAKTRAKKLLTTKKAKK